MRLTTTLRPRGFTLIEMAVVVFVMALILGSILVPLSTQVEQRQVAEARRQIEEIKDLLIGYAIAFGTLPCPDKVVAGGVGEPNDGLEDFDGGACVDPGSEGNVPWATLGAPATDPWGNRYRYRVTPAYAQRAPAAPFTLATLGTIRVCRTLTAGTCAPFDLLTVVPPQLNSPVAAVLSHGPNGWGAISRTNTLVLPPSCATFAGCAAIGSDEFANGDGNALFVSREQSTSVHAGGEFDDIVSWISPLTLKQRMVAVGRLP